MTEQTFSDNFFEPNRPPEEILAPKDRVIRVRFKTREDAVAFTAKTGIPVLPGDKNRARFPLGVALDEFF